MNTGAEIVGGSPYTGNKWGSIAQGTGISSRSRPVTPAGRLMNQPGAHGVATSRTTSLLLPKKSALERR